MTTEEFDVMVSRGGCWIWIGKKNANGYGTLATKKATLAHRLSWELHVGPIPNGMSVLHHCDTPACVRPEHLFLGTRADNVRDMDAKGRRGFAIGVLNGRTTTPQTTARGSHHGMAALTEDDVRAIRREYAGRRGQQSELGRRFGVAHCTIASIVKGKTWTHV